MRLRDLKDKLQTAVKTISSQNEVIADQDDQIYDYNILINKLLSHDNSLNKIIENHYKCEECNQ